jgi:hypothetical protein
MSSAASNYFSRFAPPQPEIDFLGAARCGFGSPFANCGSRPSQNEEDLAQQQDSSSKIEPKRSRVCFVCGGPTETFHLNYGASTCFSCRAFFRRAIQKTRNPNFECKHGGRCVVTLKTRRRCQKCRWDLCIAAGMKPEFVLDDGQKRVRFRRMIRKRKKQLDPVDGGRRKNLFKQKASSPEHQQQTEFAPQSMCGWSDTENVSTPVDGCVAYSPDWNYGSGDEQNAFDTSALPASSNQADARSIHQMQVAVQPPPVAAVALQLQDLPASAQNSPEEFVGEHSSPRQVPFKLDLTQLVRRSLDKVPAPSSSYFSFDDAGPSTAAVAATSSPVKSEDVTAVGGPDEPACLVSEGKVRMMRFLDRACYTWAEVCQNMIIDQDVLNALLLFHTRGTPLTKEMIKRHVKTLAMLFCEFAKSQPEFASLCKGDQRKLLCRNTPLFVQYILGRYFMADTGQDQMLWILASQAQAQALLYNHTNLNHVSFKLFDHALNLFHEHSATEIYEEHARRISIPTLSTGCNSLVALAVLYSTSYAMFMDDHDAVQQHLKYVHTVANWAHENFGSAGRDELQTITASLLAMASFFESKITWNDEASRSSFNELQRELVMPYTLEEERWLYHHFDAFNAAYHEVSFGEDLVREFVMYTYDVPLSRHFMPRVMALWAERFRRVMATHEEFNCLSESDKIIKYNNTAYDAVALSFTKFESYETGNQQLRFALGYLDDKIMVEKIASVMDISKIKKMMIKDVNEDIHLLDPSDLNRYTLLIKNLSELVKNMETFKLMTLITLFSGEGVSDTGIARLQRKYLFLLRRRLNHYEGEVGEYLYAKFKSGLCDIKELSVIMQKMIVVP